MAIPELYSTRQKYLRGEFPDVYHYDILPQQLKTQIITIVKDAFGVGGDAFEGYEYIHRTLFEAYEDYSRQFKHHENDKGMYGEDVIKFLYLCENIELALSAIELSFQYIDKNIRTNANYIYSRVQNVRRKPDEAIKDLNSRFKEHCVGYQFDSGILIKINSQFIHAEIVKPTLMILQSEDRFKGANEEFINAHEHYRTGRNKECLVAALKSFESLIKAIFTKQGWTEYKPSDPVKKLLDICFEKKLIPDYMQSQFSSLRGVLEGGLPTVRNREGGHGQGVEITRVSDSLASYALHLAASNIVFLSKLEQEKFGT